MKKLYKNLFVLFTSLVVSSSVLAVAPNIKTQGVENELQICVDNLFTSLHGQDLANIRFNWKLLKAFLNSTGIGAKVLDPVLDDISQLISEENFPSQTAQQKLVLMEASEKTSLLLYALNQNDVTVDLPKKPQNLNNINQWKKIDVQEILNLEKEYDLSAKKYNFLHNEEENFAQILFKKFAGLVDSLNETHKNDLSLFEEKQTYTNLPEQERNALLWSLNSWEGWQITFLQTFNYGYNGQTDDNLLPKILEQAHEKQVKHYDSLLLNNYKKYRSLLGQAQHCLNQFKSFIKPFENCNLAPEKFEPFFTKIMQLRENNKAGNYWFIPPMDEYVKTISSFIMEHTSLVQQNLHESLNKEEDLPEYINKSIQSILREDLLLIYQMAAQSKNVPSKTSQLLADGPVRYGIRESIVQVLGCKKGLSAQEHAWDFLCFSIKPKERAYLLEQLSTMKKSDKQYKDKNDLIQKNKNCTSWLPQPTTWSWRSTLKAATATCAVGALVSAYLAYKYRTPIKNSLSNTLTFSKQSALSGYNYLRSGYNFAYNKLAPLGNKYYSQLGALFAKKSPIK